MEQQVEFTSEGDVVRGVLYRPDGAEGPLPTVVMAGGWAYTKEIVQPHVARAVNTAGVQVLVFDYRFFGESGGARRQHVDPWAQVEDYKNAVSYVERRDDVDPARIGAYGISYSGGHVLILAATDPRVRSVVSVVPVVDGYANMRRSHGEMRFRELLEVILADRRSRAAGEPDGYLPMSTTTPATVLATWPQPDAAEVFEQLRQTEAPLHEHRNTIQSVELLLDYTVFPYLDRILSKSVCMLVADDDDHTLWDLEIKAFNELPTPSKRLAIMPKIGHMDIYASNAPDQNLMARETTAWFAETLRAAAGDLAGTAA